ncbi:MAG: FAD-dependent oxidoreductase [Coriobacteriales bacterium]|jgi:fumarate reductase flavoprotein subunit|nr:FAD-dependent oxidoreductase [Coriobacteriales bacterium]
MEQEVNRRQFLSGVGLLAAMGATGALAACSPAQSNDYTSQTDDAPTAQTEQQQIDTSTIVETRTCDILIVGAGGSGLAAAVQASDLGAQVICIESQSVVGGNLNGVEGCFGIGSSMQKEQGIVIDPGSTIRAELAASQFRASGLGYVDMVHASGENIDWLIEKGVQFEGVDVDKGDILVFHRFGNRGMKDYVEPMAATAQTNGVELLMETKGEKLIQDADGTVIGAYASTANGMIQIDAKAVILATGGYADNDTFMDELGIPKDKRRISGMPGHDGSGHIMATEIGAVSNRSNASILGAFFVEGTPGYYDNGRFAFLIGVAAPYAIWVNEYGERFVNEDFTAENIMLMSIPGRLTKDYFIIMDAAMMDIYLNGEAEGYQQLDDAIAAKSIVKSDTISDLCRELGMDTDTFAQTIERYNGFVDAGSDGDFGKSTNVLMPLGTGPFYAIKTLIEIPTTIGSIKTDRSFRAVDKNDQPLDGLYVVGTEGAMLWANVYTINISGSCNANNVNSGRMAARDAAAKL